MLGVINNHLEICTGFKCPCKDMIALCDKRRQKDLALDWDEEHPHSHFKTKTSHQPTQGGSSM